MDTIKINLEGLNSLTPKTADEVIVEIRRVMGPLVARSGKVLVITVGAHHGDLQITFDNSPAMGPARKCGAVLFGDDGTGTVFVKAHKEQRVCRPINPHNKDTRKVLTTSWLLGPALANTAIHELGHFIAGLEHVHDPTNFMITGGAPLPPSQRTMAAKREFFAGKKRFTLAQEERLIDHLKRKDWMDPL